MDSETKEIRKMEIKNYREKKQKKSFSVTTFIADETVQTLYNYLDPLKSAVLLKV